MGCQMTENGIFQIIFYLSILLALSVPLGWYMARVYEGQPCGLNLVLAPIERLFYRMCGIDPHQEMHWQKYLSAMLFFNLLGMLAVYAIQRFQFYLPLNPQQLSGVTPDIAFNTAASFATNTNWQAYSGETTMSNLTQMLAMTVQNFLSAATGMALVVALIRGLVRHESNTLGNFWVDIVRGTFYILLPLSLILAVTLSAQGVVQTFKSHQAVDLIAPFTYQTPLLDASGHPITDVTGHVQTQQVQIKQQILAMGPVASQIAIKQLGTNGGGFFNANSAHPFENPNAISNFLEMLAILLIPVALCFTFGQMCRDKRQGLALLLAMLVMLIPLIGVTVIAEQAGNPALQQLNIDQTAQHNLFPGGNMEGKETRFGITNSALWATATTATSNGSVNSMHDSYQPLGGLIPLWLMHLGEVVFGGVGSGLYGMLMLVIITVFVAGLMVGRTPEYLGKKIEPFEMKMASIAVLVMPLFVLFFTAIVAVTYAGTSATANPSAHGFSEMLYAFTSMVNNNGSAFAGLNASKPLYTILGGVGILLGRYFIAIPTIALAGSLVQKKKIPSGSGTLLTHTPLFVMLLVAVTIVLGALTFFPALALGPIVEHVMLWGPYAQ
jgi:K+-transporting ATPase ATPase A chain